MKSSIQLTKARNIDLNKCILCQKIKDNKGDRRLTSTEKGRQLIISTSTDILKDDLISDVKGEELCLLKYHVNTCYSRYIRQRDRTESKALEKNCENAGPSEASNQEEFKADCRETKRRRISTEQPGNKVSEKPCIICNQVKHQGENKKYRICEVKCAKQFLSAERFFNDDVHRQTILLETHGDVFAADVFYHKKCLNRYMVTFEREMTSVINYEGDISNELAKEVCQAVLQELDFKGKAYSVSDCRDEMNRKLNEAGIGKYNSRFHYS